MTDQEKLTLLRAALNDLRPHLSTLPDRRRVDEVLALTAPSRPVQTAR
jgi:hypothetical protein